MTIEEVADLLGIDPTACSFPLDEEITVEILRLQGRLAEVVAEAREELPKLPGSWEWQPDQLSALLGDCAPNSTQIWVHSDGEISISAGDGDCIDGNELLEVMRLVKGQAI